MSKLKVLRFYYALAISVFILVVFTTYANSPKSLWLRLDHGFKQFYNPVLQLSRQHHNDNNDDDDDDDTNDGTDDVLKAKKSRLIPNYGLLQTPPLTSKELIEKNIYASLNKLINLLNASAQNLPHLKEKVMIPFEENSDFWTKLGNGPKEKGVGTKQILNLLSKARDGLFREKHIEAISSLKNKNGFERDEDRASGVLASERALKSISSKSHMLKAFKKDKSKITLFQDFFQTTAFSSEQEDKMPNENVKIKESSESMGNPKLNSISGLRDNLNPINNTPWKTDTASLVKMLTDRIRFAKDKTQEVVLNVTCASNATLANSCDGQKSCLRRKPPADVKSRVSQLVGSTKLQLTKNILKALQQMAQKVMHTYDVILVTAASDNHFFESQAMIKSVHENVLPVLQNFTFIFYDLGLSVQQRQAMEKHCKCQVIDFPFHLFPEFMRKLQCYSWKPVLIKAHVHQANVLIWADASIRFHKDPVHLRTLIEQTRQRGIQIGGSLAVSPFRTFQSMYHYFGDEPCLYLEMTQAMATVGFYKRDPFVDRAILEPWAACAVHEDCMCALKGTFLKSKDCHRSFKMASDWMSHHGAISYGLCHRFDQSAISLILHKLYQGYYRWVMVNVLSYLDIQRRQQIDYFSTL